MTGRRPPVSRIALAAALLSATLAHAQQRAFAPYLVASVPGLANHPGYTEVSRDREGHLHLSLGQYGVWVQRGSHAGHWLRHGAGTRARSGALGWMGDTLSVQGWRSWNLFRPDGEFIACRRAGRTPGEFSIQVFPDQFLAGFRVVGELLPPWPGQGFAPRLVVAREQEVIRELAQREPEPAGIEVEFPWGGGNWEVPPPLRTTTLWGVADNGSGAVVVEQRQPRAPGMQEVRVRRVTLEGDPVFDVALRIPSLAVSPVGRERELAQWGGPSVLEALGSTIPRDTVAIHRAFRRSVHFPRFHPPVTRVVAGADGSAWLRLSSESDSVAWVRLDTSGAEEGRVMLPQPFRGAYADSSGLWGFMARAPDLLELWLAADHAPAATPLRLGPPPPESGPAFFGPCAA